WRRNRMRHSRNHDSNLSSRIVTQSGLGAFCPNCRATERDSQERQRYFMTSFSGEHKRHLRAQQPRDQRTRKLSHAGKLALTAGGLYLDNSAAKPVARYVNLHFTKANNRV